MRSCTRQIPAHLPSHTNGDRVRKERVDGPAVALEQCAADIDATRDSEVTAGERAELQAQEPCVVASVADGGRRDLKRGNG